MVPESPSIATAPSDRRSLSRAYKDAFPPMGVLAVRETGGRRVWIAASRNIDGLINRLRFELRQGQARPPALQAAWHAGGEAALSFEVIERLRRRDDPAFDYSAELLTLRSLWCEELGGEALGNVR